MYGWVTTTTTTVLRPFFRDHPGEPVPEEKLLDFMVQGKINRGRHTDHPAGRHSIWTKQCQPPLSPHFLQAGCPSCRPTNIVTEQYAYSYKETLIENINVSGGITLAKNSWISINITVGYV